MPEDDRQRMKAAARRLGLGATGRHPLPPVSAEDEGELKVAVSSDVKRRLVFLNFGMPVAWMGMPPEQAREFARAIVKHSEQCEGKGDDDGV